MLSASPVQFAQVDQLKIEIYPNAKALGQAAAAAGAEEMIRLGKLHDAFAVMFATGASQLETLHALTSTAGIPWEKITGFHMDEYIGFDANHPASFRRYLRENLQRKVSLKAFHEIDGTAPDIEAECQRYARELQRAAPSLCLFGIGENGHLAFNDPAEANFQDPLDVRIAQLDEECRAQQAGEGWFPSLADVPTEAITVTIPALLRIPRLILSVPGKRKAAIIERVLNAPVSTQYPATIVRQHANATLYLDADSASLIADNL